MRRAAIVFVGGGIGACLRAVLLSALSSWGRPFPAAVLLANLLGAFILGIVYVLADEAGLLRVETRLFLAVGVLGGFTTFSTFGWGADTLLAHGAHMVAGLLYVATSVVGGIVAVLLGLVAGRALVAALERRGVVVPARPAVRGARADMAAVEAEDRDEPA